MESANSVKILEVCQVSPATNSTESTNVSILPITFLESAWIKFLPTENIMFYKLTDITSVIFHTTILPTLKQSLSQTLHHFRPLAGNLTWPPESPRPIIVYSQNHNIPLTIAESNVDFNGFVSKKIHENGELRPYIPTLLISETTASTMALQITLFPGKGYCIGITTHHAVFDGKSAFMFLKAWAYISKHMAENGNILTSLPQELTPSFDRNQIVDPVGIESLYLNHWIAVNKLDSESNPRSLRLGKHFLLSHKNDSVHSVFQLSPENIKKIKENVALYHKKQLRFSTFVVISAYVIVSLVKAKRGDKDRKVALLFAVDCRSRSAIDPPIPQNHFGCAVFGHDIVEEAATLMEENGVAIVAGKMASYINEIEKKLLQGAKERYERIISSVEIEKIAIAGSTRFSFYKMDFGWGKPEIVKIASINPDAFSMMEGRDGFGVEVGVSLPRDQMEDFASLFAQGLNMQ